MRKILIAVLAAIIPSLSWADGVQESDSVLVDSIESIDAIETIDAIDAIESINNVASPQEEQYYTNWLGEKCIDFGTNAPLYYNWKRDLTYAGVPLFLSSFIIKDKKRAFRSARFSLDKNWKTEIDNYTQFSPYAVAVGLKALGYDGRSSWDRLAVSTLASNAVMALAVNATKYSVKEMRPDNSTRNSFPSGHTATAFVAATVLHKEYGLTRSPWFSVGGYAVAMSTGFMRVLNNRHWISDVMAGAGIGILSTELGYFIGDILYKNNGIMRRELINPTNPNHPSFFDIQMGIGMHSKTISFDYEDGSSDNIELGTSTAVGVEGAYFFNKYLGVGGLVRATTTPAKELNLYEQTDDTSEGLVSAMNSMNNVLEFADLPQIHHINIYNSNFVDFSFDAGLYGNLPLTKHLSLGAKFLVGARVSSGYEYKAQVGYREQAKDASGNPIYTGVINPAEGEPSIWEPVYVFDNADGTTFVSNETLQPDVTKKYNYHFDQSKYIGDEYTFAEVTGDKSFNYICGLSLTYRYKENFSWKIFLDYDNSKTNYEFKFNLLDKKSATAMKGIAAEKFGTSDLDEAIDMISDTHYSGFAKKRMYFWTLGAAFSINF